MRPTVSIVIPVFNGAAYLREAVESALAQTYTPIEVLVVDDGSDDGGRTDAVARSYGERIRYLRKANGGVGSALNLGIREMRGEYFSWLSADDVYTPSKIEVQLRASPQAAARVVLYGDYDLIDAASRRIGTWRGAAIAPESFRGALMTEYPINGCTALIPRRAFDEVGLFAEDLPTTQDYAMWFRMAKRFDFVHLPEVVLESRIHPDQGSIRLSSSTEKNRFYIGCLYQLYEEQYAPAGESASLFFAEVAVALKRRKLREAAAHAARLSLRAGGARRRWLEPRWVTRRSHYLLFDWLQRYRALESRLRRVGRAPAPHP